MKTKLLLIVCAFLCAGLFFTSCDKDENTPDTDAKGKIELKCINPGLEVLDDFYNSPRSTTSPTKVAYENPPLTGEVTETIMISMKMVIGDVWISQDEIKEGEPDNLNWVKLTPTTNTEYKDFEDFSFPEVEIPAGEYKSYKYQFKNRWYRVCLSTDDRDVRYELLETMGSSDDYCDENDESWAPLSYGTPNGSFRINKKSGKFELASEGEKVGSFKIEEGKKANLFWRLGAGEIGFCINNLIDNNGNRKWDCGIDDVDIECPENIKYMWDFKVEYE